MFITLVGFILFSGVGVNEILENLGGLFGIGTSSLVNKESIYYLISYALVLIIAIIASTPILKNIFLKLKEKVPKVINILEPIVLSILLIICTSYLVDGSFNPFLYFRF